VLLVQYWLEVLAQSTPGHYDLCGKSAKGPAGLSRKTSPPGAMKCKHVDQQQMGQSEAWQPSTFIQNTGGTRRDCNVHAQVMV